MTYPNLDDSADLSASEAHVAAVWPLERGQRVDIHSDACPIYDGEECGCVPFIVRGPTRFA